MWKKIGALRWDALRAGISWRLWGIGLGALNFTFVSLDFDLVFVAFNFQVRRLWVFGFVDGWGIVARFERSLHRLVC